MREIKFKGIRADSGAWVYGDLVHGVNHKSGKTYILPVVGGVQPLSGCDPLDGYEVYPETICQFTGLKDKNGVEIFEGDILKIDEGHPVEVRYEKIYASFGIWRKGWAFLHYFHEAVDPKDCEVISNIHDKAQQIVRRSISLWVEGFAVTGERQGASMIGTYEAEDLDDAVKQYMETHKGDVDWDRFGRGRHAIWACEIFDNEEEARKSFG